MKNIILFLSLIISINTYSQSHLQDVSSPDISGYNHLYNIIGDNNLTCMSIEYSVGDGIIREKGVFNYKGIPSIYLTSKGNTILINSEVSTDKLIVYLYKETESNKNYITFLKTILNYNE